MDVSVERLLVHPQETLVKVMSTMDSARLGIALVVNDVGQLLGIVRDGDIRRGLLRGADLQDGVEAIMTRDPVVFPEGLRWRRPLCCHYNCAWL